MHKRTPEIKTQAEMLGDSIEVLLEDIEDMNRKGKNGTKVLEYFLNPEVDFSGLLAVNQKIDKTDDTSAMLRATILSMRALMPDPDRSMIFFQLQNMMRDYGLEWGELILKIKERIYQ